MRKNKNRGFQQLRVWNDAIDFYAANSKVFQVLSYSLRRVSSQQLASAAFKLENGLLKPVEKLEQKRDDGTWVDQMVVKESNVAYGCD